MEQRGRNRWQRFWSPKPQKWLELAANPGETELRRLGADHRYVPLLTTAPGIAWVLGYTIAAEIGDIKPLPTHQAAPRQTTRRQGRRALTRRRKPL
jgi:hypothetical protein